MGNLRSVEKALERVGAEVDDHPDLDRAADGRRAGPARRRRLSARRWTHRASSASTPLIARAGRRRHARARHLPRHAAPVRVLDRARRGAGASGSLAGEVSELDAPGLKVPHIGWEPVRWERESRARPTGIDDGDALLLRPRLRAPPAPTPTTWSATAEHGERFACAVDATAALRRPVSPGEVERRRACGCSPTSPASAPRSRPALDPLPGDRHPRRPRGAADAGRLRARDRLRRRPGRRRAALGRAGRRGAARRRPRRRPRGRPVNLDARRADLRGGRRAGPGRRRPAQRRGRRRGARGRRATGRCSAPPRSADPALVEALAAEHGERIVVSADARGGRVAVEGWERETQIELGGADRRARRRAACGASSTRRSRSTGRSRGPALDEALGAVAGAAAEAAGAELGSTRAASAALEHLRGLRRARRCRRARAA